MKRGNFKSSVCGGSKAASSGLIANTNTPYCLPINYVDKNGKNPDVGDIIHPKDIVFSKEALKDDKWLFVRDGKDVIELTRKMFNNWPRYNYCLVIQSQEEVDKTNRTNRDLKKIMDKEAGRRENRRQNFKIDIDLKNLEPIFVKAKYYSLEEFKEKNKTGYFPDIINNNFKAGDEIWYYSEFNLDYLGWLKSVFILVRNEKVICSPLIMQMESYTGNCNSETTTRFLAERGII